MQYISNYFNYNRRKSDEVLIGSVALGGDNPIRLQSMTNTNTMNTEASVEQAIRIADAGGEYVRLTAQGVREAENLQQIHTQLRGKGYSTPLIADIHFNPKAAEVAAQFVEKVRINPGNFVDSIKTFAEIEYTDKEYQAEIEKIRSKFIPLLSICKKNNTAIRIGVNHGSLSDRIISRYGDTPAGMVESCMEFLRICRDENFHKIVISMKSSNVLVMVHSVRLLVAAMNKENMYYPLHLGVTEAGDGEDGRVKSAVGIGALLADGIGDTIRVSLSEEPELEIPVARKLVDYIQTRNNHPTITGVTCEKFTPYSYNRRETTFINNIGGKKPPIVIAEKNSNYSIQPDFIYPDFEKNIQFINLNCNELSIEKIQHLSREKDAVLLLTSSHINPVGELRAAFHLLLNNNCTTPVIIHRCYEENDVESLQIKAATDLGALFIDGFGDGIYLQNKGSITPEEINSIAFGILQASRVRVSKTEYISCPGCGRTLFDLQTTIARVKAKTSHLKGLKIGIMGCIVNGPGEMADADYGYVGAGKGKISLYKKKLCVEKNIPEEEAVDKLIELIKKEGDWHE
jgi:(E)-4-hydroxy-3-methylbut-2-enyl-diphosphate synthase